MYALQALLAFSLPPAAAAAHVAALHRLTTAADSGGNAQAASGSGKAAGKQQGGGKGRGKSAAGAPSQWCARMLEAAHEVLVKAVERRGVVRAAAWCARGQGLALLVLLAGGATKVYGRKDM